MEQADTPKKQARKLPKNNARYQAAIENLHGHTWKPGQSGNPNGRPKGALNHETKLELIAVQIQASINRVEKEQGRSLLDHFIERAFNDDTVLIAVMKKMMPDLIKKDGDSDSETNIFYISVPTNYDINNLPPRIQEMIKLGILKPRMEVPAPALEAVNNG